MLSSNSLPMMKSRCDMYEQLDIFDFLNVDTPKEQRQVPKRLNVGDKVGRLVLGDVVIGTIYKVEGNDTHFFYRTDKGCFDSTARTDIEQMQIEAEEIRKKFDTITIDRFEKFFAVEYPPRECDGHVMYAMVGIYKSMLFWKEDYTYQFLENVKNIAKAYEEKVFKITHEWYGDKPERRYKILENPLPVKTLYYSNSRKCYAKAGYVEYNR